MGKGLGINHKKSEDVGVATLSYLDYKVYLGVPKSERLGCATVYNNICLVYLLIIELQLMYIIILICSL